MSGTDAAWVVIVGGGLATFGVRALFLVLARRLQDVSPLAREGLRMIPPAALAALAVPALLRADGALDLTSTRALAGLLAAVVALRTKNVLATIVVGMLAVVALDHLSAW